MRSGGTPASVPIPACRVARKACAINTGVAIPATRRRLPWRSIGLLAATFVLLRLPSLLEPNWYSDEGTYADIGNALLHGAVLYRDVWDNKPPGVYWLFAGIIAVFGPGAPVVHAVLAGIVAAGVVAVWVLGRRWGGPAVATVAALLAIVLMSLPNLEGDILNAEIVGAVLVLWAMVALTAADDDRRPAVGAGALVGAALLFKGVFVFDLVAVLAVPLWTARAAARSWRSAVPAMAAVAAGAATVVGLAAVWLWAAGSLGGVLNVLLRQDVTYVQVASGRRGAILQSPGPGTRHLLTVLLGARLAVVLVGLGAAAAWLSRRGHRWAAVVSFWIGCDLAGAMVSARGFSHYVQQATGALALGAALLAVHLWRQGRAGRPAAVVVVLATLPVLQLTLFLPAAEIALARHQPRPPFENGSFHTSQVARYYRLTWDHLTGAGSTAGYQAIFPTDLRRQDAAVEVFRRYSRPADRVFLWGDLHWTYALSDRLPAGRYVSLNSAYAVDPGSQRRLVAELTARPPAVLIAEDPLPAPVLDLLHRLAFHRLPGAAGGADAWLAPWAGRGGGVAQAS